MSRGGHLPLITVGFLLLFTHIVILGTNGAVNYGPLAPVLYYECDGINCGTDLPHGCRSKSKLPQLICTKGHAWGCIEKPYYCVSTTYYPYSTYTCANRQFHNNLVCNKCLLDITPTGQKRYYMIACTTDFKMYMVTGCYAGCDTRYCSAATQLIKPYCTPIPALGVNMIAASNIFACNYTQYDQYSSEDCKDKTDIVRIQYPPQMTCEANYVKNFSFYYECQDKTYTPSATTSLPGGGEDVVKTQTPSQDNTVSASRSLLPPSALEHLTATETIQPPTDVPAVPLTTDDVTTSPPSPPSTTGVPPTTSAVPTTTDVPPAATTSDPSTAPPTTSTPQPSTVAPASTTSTSEAPQTSTPVPPTTAAAEPSSLPVVTDPATAAPSTATTTGTTAPPMTTANPTTVVQSLEPQTSDNNPTDTTVFITTGEIATTAPPSTTNDATSMTTTANVLTSLTTIDGASTAAATEWTPLPTDSTVVDPVTDDGDAPTSVATTGAVTMPTFTTGTSEPTTTAVTTPQPTPMPTTTPPPSPPAPTQTPSTGPPQPSTAPPGDTFDMVVRCSAFNAEMIGFFAKNTGFPSKDFKVVDLDKSNCGKPGATKTVELIVATDEAAEKVRQLPPGTLSSFGIDSMSAVNEKDEALHQTPDGDGEDDTVNWAAIGGIAGGLALCAFCLVAALWYRRRKTRLAYAKDDQPKPLLDPGRNNMIFDVDAEEAEELMHVNQRRMVMDAEAATTPQLGSNSDSRSSPLLSVRSSHTVGSPNLLIPPSHGHNNVASSSSLLSAPPSTVAASPQKVNPLYDDFL